MNGAASNYPFLCVDRNIYGRGNPCYPPQTETECNPSHVFCSNTAPVVPVATDEPSAAPTIEGVCEYGYYWTTLLRHSCWGNFPNFWPEDGSNPTLAECTAFCALDQNCNAAEYQNGGQWCEIV